MIFSSHHITRVPRRDTWGRYTRWLAFLKIYRLVPRIALTVTTVDFKLFLYQQSSSRRLVARSSAESIVCCCFVARVLQQNTCLCACTQYHSRRSHPSTFSVRYTRHYCSPNDSHPVHVGTSPQRPHLDFQVDMANQNIMLSKGKLGRT